MNLTSWLIAPMKGLRVFSEDGGAWFFIVAIFPGMGAVPSMLIEYPNQLLEVNAHSYKRRLTGWGPRVLRRHISLTDIFASPRRLSVLSTTFMCCSAVRTVILIVNEEPAFVGSRPAYRRVRKNRFQISRRLWLGHQLC